jgi:hypothetical protein
MSTPVDIAQAEWARGVYEPPHGDWRRINDYIQQGLGWAWRRTYTKNRQFEWCGAFASWCYPGVQAPLRKAHFASTYRLYRWARGNARWVEPASIAAGDIVIVGEPGQTRRWGQHICIAMGPLADGAVSTTEGNAVGIAPDGRRREGVVRCVRRIDGPGKRIMYAVRPLPEDYDGA